MTNAHPNHTTLSATAGAAGVRAGRIRTEGRLLRMAHRIASLPIRRGVPR